MHTTMRFLGMAFWFPILFYLGRVRWETAPNKLKDEESKTVLCLQNRNSSVLCWPLPLPESGIAARLRLFPALLAFHGAAAPGVPGNTKTRVDERSTRDFVFYLAFGRAGLCGRNLIELLQLRWLLALVAFHRPAAPGKQKSARRCAIYARFCVLLGLWPR